MSGRVEERRSGGIEKGAWRAGLCAFTLLLIAGCAKKVTITTGTPEDSGQGSGNPAPNPQPAAGTAGPVDIGGGRRMYMVCRGAGAPTVVLVSGLRYSADEWTRPGPGQTRPTVLPEVASFTRVCAYDRPGTIVGQGPSRSSPVPQPTSALESVADLHALLTAAREPAPYVLVGHSYGGLIVRLYASTYPQEVAGMVLVDNLAEEMRSRLTPKQWALWKPLNDPTKADLAEYKDMERQDPDRSFDQVSAAPPLRPVPLVVLSADRPFGPQVKAMVAAGKAPAGTPADFGYVIDAAQKVAQKRLATLVPNAKHVTKTHSGHDIEFEQPQLVVDAIREVVDAVRRRQTGILATDEHR